MKNTKKAMSRLFLVQFCGMIQRALRKLIQYILNGLLLTLPMVITGYVIYRLFMGLDSLLPIEHRYPGMGILMLITFLAVLGYLGAKFINDTIRGWFNRLLDRIPLIKTIYKSITDLLGAFVGQKKAFNQPVLVKISEETDIEVIGFVTDEDLKELGNIQNKVGVYFPMSYSFAGHLMIVPAKNVKPIDKNAVDVMKYIVSGGVVDIEHNHDAK
ncbi:MAG: hypothetical protein RL609_1684 [Bacteroidota bacterium]|jgi:uncharacterized membrane protein